MGRQATDGTLDRCGNDVQFADIDRDMDAETRFRALFVTAYPALHRYACNRGLPDQDAQDLVAATLEVAWRRIDDVPEDEPLPWLYGLARNVWLNRLRTQRRYERLIARL